MIDKTNIFNSEEMLEIDNIAINEYLYPSIILMENAAIQFVDELKKDLHKFEKVGVFAGPGNNGGDAFVIARHLINLGKDVFIYLLGSKEQLKNDAKVNCDILKKITKKIFFIEKFEDTETFEEFKSFDLIIDGIYGTGYKYRKNEIFEKIVRSINKLTSYKVAIDMPSGVNGTKGIDGDLVIKADKTITFTALKKGFFLSNSTNFTGEIVVVDIGIPKEILDKKEGKLKYLESLDEKLNVLSQNTHKGEKGKSLIISGSNGMTGAGLLSGKACLRTGTGLVYIAVPEKLQHIFEINSIETITIPIIDDNKGYFNNSSIDKIIKILDKFDSIAIGPGLGNNNESIEFVEKIIQCSKAPVVIDADGINLISERVEILNGTKNCNIITPHLGEMSRLLKKPIDVIVKNRIEYASEFSKKYNIIVVLKGSNSVIAYPDGITYINSTGNPGMATAGSGDVLTGIITSFISQGVQVGVAAKMGVYIHGLVGDYCEKKMKFRGIIASDLIDAIPYVVNENLIR